MSNICVNCYVYVMFSKINIDPVNLHFISQSLDVEGHTGDVDLATLATTCDEKKASSVTANKPHYEAHDVEI